MKEAKRNWDNGAMLAMFSANGGQANIARGDIVRSYDFPGSRDDCYVEGVVMEQPDGERVKIHVTKEMWAGEEIQVDRFVVFAPLGVGSMTGAPAVFLIEKRKPIKEAS